MVNVGQSPQANERNRLFDAKSLIFLKKNIVLVSDTSWKRIVETIRFNGRQTAGSVYRSLAKSTAWLSGKR